MLPNNEPSLYGITANNSSRHGSELWGKNQFNSTFPLALCLFMRDSNYPPVGVISRNRMVQAVDRVWEMSDVIGRAESKLFFNFEQTFEPYRTYSRKEFDKIDLVVSVNGAHKIPLEVKLTVVPDSSTVSSDEDNWAPELVMRPVSSAYVMMGVASSLQSKNNLSLKEKAISTLKIAYNEISNWNSEIEIIQKAPLLVNALSATLDVAEAVQKPFLVQPLWRTKGQSLDLCDHCFDVFVWSDVAILRITVDQVGHSVSQYSGVDHPLRGVYQSVNRKVTRGLREVARHVRALYDLLVAGDYDYTGIYQGMRLGSQTDKAFSLSGKKSLKYLRHPRLVTPLLSRDILHKLIQNHGERELKPERRFDAAIVRMFEFHEILEN